MGLDPVAPPAVSAREVAASRHSGLPKARGKRVPVEAGVTGFWRQYVGLDGAVVGVDSFGASAPAEALFPHFGITVERLIEIINAL